MLDFLYELYYDARIRERQVLKHFLQISSSVILLKEDFKN